ncbi:flagella synthesis protein FlgN [Marinobacter orientalis]|uniref:Flagellar protein FlgN n=1 Tax=Marinobacter orientalis TaxID=1928859 RepID=A0A7Y0REN4_9GAMM|nr:flagellar protein FlgN [Marinobacter orientalis]NMT64828.1 flagellar protein FlgN [Marinobacter orientalis]TGX48819.1 flagellar protein FlgN [Marinobacter orientalis]
MAAIDELKDLLAEDIRKLDTLADVLNQEKSCLSSSDVSKLETLTGEKNRLLEQVRESAKRKIRLMVAMGFRPDSGEPSRFIRSAGLPDLVALWEDADRRLRACQAINQSNGRVISHLQKRLSRLTDIFRGVSGHQKLYGAQGEQKAVSHSTILASA